MRIVLAGAQDDGYHAYCSTVTAITNKKPMKNIVEHLEKFVDIGLSLSVEKNTSKLLKKILIGAKEITHADGGTLYLVRDDVVHIDIFYSDSLGYTLISSQDHIINMPDIPLYNAEGRPNLNNVVTCCYHKNETLNIPDAYETNDFDFTETKVWDERIHYHSKSFLTIPLKDHNNETIGIVQLINAIDPETKAIIAFDSTAQRLAEALASIVATVLTKQRLIRESMNYNQFVLATQQFDPED